MEHATRQFWTTMPAEGGPRKKLHYHLAALSRMVEERPALFTVLGELDLRAKRDAAVRSIVDRYEESWRAALTEVFRGGVEEGAWAEELEIAAATETTIAAVKGVGLNPGSAGDVLYQLERLLVRRPPDGGISG